MGLKNIYSNFKSQIFYDDYINGDSIYISYDRANRVAIYWSAFSASFDVVNINEC